MYDNLILFEDHEKSGLAEGFLPSMPLLQLSCSVTSQHKSKQIHQSQSLKIKKCSKKSRQIGVPLFQLRERKRKDIKSFIQNYFKPAFIIAIREKSFLSGSKWMC